MTVSDVDANLTLDSEKKGHARVVWSDGSNSSTPMRPCRVRRDGMLYPATRDPPPPPPSVWSREHCLRRQQPDLIISEQSLWKEVVWILSARRQTGREDLCHSRGLPSTAAQTLWSIGAFLSNEKRTLLHLHLLPSSVRLSSPFVLIQASFTALFYYFF